MQILLASAKIMRDSHSGCAMPVSEPRFQAIASMLAGDLSHKTGAQLSELFGCSPEIGETNRRRFSIFGTDEAELLNAVYAYHGQAYKHLNADEFSEEDLIWADSHLWISSCLYGLLRPLDGINLYRMEGGFELPSTGGRKVRDFWKPYLTDVLIESVLSDDGVLIYLDTEEFRHLFDWRRVEEEVPVIVEPRFHVLKNGRPTTPSVWAKTCRGAMARYIIENRVSEVAELRRFEYEGFRFLETLEGQFVFVNGQMQR